MKHLMRILIVMSLLIMTFGVGAAPASAQASNIVHIVRYGETLAIIAGYYGTTWQAIASLNGLWNPNLIYAGQRLVIPATGGPYNPGPIYGRNVHIVQPGENLFRISLAYGYDWYTVAALNGITNPNRIYVGQRILIPQTRYHTVGYGETLASIARYYGSSVAAISSANGLWNPNLIYPGQRLLIP
jgi:spore germination protein